MTQPTPQVFDDPEALAQAAAARVAALVQEAIRERGRCHLALAGGNTPRALYRRLARLPLDWSAVVVWFGDERCVPPDHPDSNYRMAREALLDHVSVPADQVHPMDARLDRLWMEVGAYASLLRREAPADPGGHPRLDVVLLGMGADGHTASLFPGTCALHDRRPVAATYVPRLKAWRMTLTLPTLNAARNVLFLVAGADKAGALAAALGRGERPPAGRVAPADGALEWLVDRAAASRL